MGVVLSTISLRRRAVISAGMVLLVLLLPGCARPSGGLTLSGSTSVQPFAEMLAEYYLAKHPDKLINVQGGGSSAGIQAVMTGVADIGMSSRPLSGSELDLVQIEIARDAIAVVVHPSNPVDRLSIEQVRGIYSGRFRRWSEVGGLDHPVVVVTREEGSGTREAFQHLIMGGMQIDPGALVQDSNGAARQVVRADPNAVSYISLGLVDETLRGVSIEGVEPTVENVESGRYTLVRSFLFVLRAPPEGDARAFVDYVLGPEGQKPLLEEGLLGPALRP